VTDGKWVDDDEHPGRPGTSKTVRKKLTKSFGPIVYERLGGHGKCRSRNGSTEFT